MIVERNENMKLCVDDVQFFFQITWRTLVICGTILLLMPRLLMPRLLMTRLLMSRLRLRRLRLNCWGGWGCWGWGGWCHDCWCHGCFHLWKTRWGQQWILRVVETLHRHIRWVEERIHTLYYSVIKKNKKGFIYGGFCRVLFIFYGDFYGLMEMSGKR